MTTHTRTPAPTARTPYTLARNTAESTRLNLQHTIYVQNAGYLLHPSLAPTLPPQARIAEIGTGTGIWLRALALQSAPQNPAWTYTGFDISAAQSPPPVPNNNPCHFALLDILAPVPAHLIARFDLIHLRLLICGLTGPDWALAASNHEFDHRARLLPSPPTLSTPTEATTQLIALAITGQTREHKFLANVPALPHTLRAAGFTAVTHETFPSDRHGGAAMRAKCTDVMVGATSMLAEYAVGKYPDLGVTGEEFAALVARARGEVEGGKAFYRWDMHVVTGRKALLS
ncbi:hypothetical protein LTR08_001187 [Meristemomyces frigidus]|nr:hypothetical protein LTR08_001187 [Meristemomyces frigidus]